MSDKIEQYTAKLARYLRLRNVDEEQVQEAIWTVESHTADSGTSPQQAFGSPRNYARTFKPAVGNSGDTPLYLAGWLIASLAAALLILSMTRRDQEPLLGFLSPTAGVMLASVVLVLWIVLVVARLTRRPKRNPAKLPGGDVRAEPST